MSGTCPGSSGQGAGLLFGLPAWVNRVYDACLGRGDASCALHAEEVEPHQAESMHGGMQAFMELARQSPQLIGGLPEPMVQAINRNDTEELQRIFRCTICAAPPRHRPARHCHP